MCWLSLLGDRFVVETGYDKNRSVPISKLIEIGLIVGVYTHPDGHLILLSNLAPWFFIATYDLTTDSYHTDGFHYGIEVKFEVVLANSKVLEKLLGQRTPGCMNKGCWTLYNGPNPSEIALWIAMARQDTRRLDAINTNNENTWYLIKTHTDGEIESMRFVKKATNKAKSEYLESLKTQPFPLLLRL